MDGGLGAEAQLGRGAGFGAQARLVGKVEEGRVDQGYPRCGGVDDQQPADDRERLPRRRAAQIRGQVGGTEGDGGQIRCAHQLGDRGDPSARFDEGDHRRDVRPPRRRCVATMASDRRRLTFGHHDRIETPTRPGERVEVPQPGARGGRVDPDGLEHTRRTPVRPAAPAALARATSLSRAGDRILEIDDQAVRARGGGTVEPPRLRSGGVQPAAHPRHPLCLISHRTPLCAVPVTLQRPRDVIDRGRAR